MTFSPGIRDGRVIPHASPAPIGRLAAAVAGDERWHVLSSGGGKTRCWPADAGPGDADSAPRLDRESSSLALAPLADGTDIVVARTKDRFRSEEEHTLLRWERASGQPLGEPVPLRAPRLYFTFRDPLAVAATPDGPVAVTNAADGGLQRWDVATGRPVGEPFGQEHGVVLALTSGTLPDGSPVIISGGLDSLLRRWDPASGTEIGEPIRGCGRAVVLAVMRLPDGRSVVTVLSGQGNVRRHDLLTGEPVGPKISTGWEPGRRIRVCPGRMAVAATADGAVIATCTGLSRRSVQLWDLVSGEPRGELRGFQPAAVGDLAAASLGDGTPLLFIGDSYGNVRGFDARDRRPVGMPVQPHGTCAMSVLPVTAPGERPMLAVSGASTRLVDAGTGEPVGMQCGAHDGGDWYGMAVARLPDGRIMLAARGEDGLTRHDMISGIGYPRSESNTIWDVAAATLPDGRVIIAGAGHDGRVHRWDAATGEALGEPLQGHRSIVRAVTVARQADGRPMLITGCEAGDVLRWDAESGERIGPQFAGTDDDVFDLTVIDMPDGRQILAGLDRHALYRWDPVTGKSPPPARAGGWPSFVATHVGKDGVPVAFVSVVDTDGAGWKDKPVERWRLDTLTRIDPPLPAAFRAVFDDDGTTWMVLAEPDGSLAVKPLPPVPEDPWPDALC